MHSDAFRRIFLRVQYHFFKNAVIIDTKATIDLDFLGERRLQQELAEAGFAAEKPSLFVAEGLIMYLGPEGILSSCSVRRKRMSS